MIKRLTTIVKNSIVKNKFVSAFAVAGIGIVAAVNFAFAQLPADYRSWENKDSFEEYGMRFDTYRSSDGKTSVEEIYLNIKGKDFVLRFPELIIINMLNYGYPTVYTPEGEALPNYLCLQCHNKRGA